MMAESMSLKPCSTAAAIALKNWMQANNVKGTLRMIGTPAEEGGSGKVYMVRDGVFNDVDSRAIQTEVFELPATCFAEDEGSFTNSCRWLQWHTPAVPPPGEALWDIQIMSAIFLRLRELYAEEGGALPYGSGILCDFM